VKSLPAQGFARVLSNVGLAGCALSVLVHLITLLGFYSKAILNFQLGLFLAIFPMSLPVFFAQARLMSGLPPRDRVRLFDPKHNSRIREKIILGNTPAWLRKLFSALLYYFIIFFVVFAYRNISNKTTSEPVEVQMFSIGAGVFYSAIAALLTSYARTDHPLTLVEI
jgi:hypothetical protein